MEDFSYWAWSTPWGHVLSLKSFIEILSWAEQSGTQFFSLSNLVGVWVFFTWFIFYTYRNVIINQKKLKKKSFEKTQNDELFSSPKRKNALLKLVLKQSFRPNILMTNWCLKVENRLQDMFLKLLTNLISWKLAQLIFLSKRQIKPWADLPTVDSSKK